MKRLEITHGKKKKLAHYRNSRAQKKRLISAEEENNCLHVNKWEGNAHIYREKNGMRTCTQNQ